MVGSRCESSRELRIQLKDARDLRVLLGCVFSVPSRRSSDIAMASADAWSAVERPCGSSARR
jgi:hypothetical protein